MSNILSSLLTIWQQDKDNLDWVLGTVIETAGSCYRKTGAMMLMNGLGQWYGLLSGGCLEADILRLAKQVMSSQKSKIITYDMREEGDFAEALGIGCGGMVRILLHPVSAANNYLSLDLLLSQIKARGAGWYLLLAEANQTAKASNANLLTSDIASDIAGFDHSGTSRVAIVEFNSSSPAISNSTADKWLALPIKPQPHLMVFGGGVDARSVVAIAAELGWRITLVDNRSAYAKPQHFPKVESIMRRSAQELVFSPILTSIDAAVVMGHNLSMDAAAIKALQDSSAKYIGLLGPPHRRQLVLEKAELSEEQLTIAIHGPAGLRLGGELPESIALSILAECHQVLENG